MAVGLEKKTNWLVNISHLRVYVWVVRYRVIVNSQEGALEISTKFDSALEIWNLPRILEIQKRQGRIEKLHFQNHTKYIK